ncbi:MAG: hypothetical protein AUK35_08625 [Zetaproteobacteria bacterium CG2_30_46_52]|nr:MAG: hypothetical protein AUK35_08625 [Zetaproteobacteria bacterium CG2_30_46_52]
MLESGQKIRYGKLIRHTSLRQKTISYNDFAKRQQQARIASNGRRRASLRSIDIYRLLSPYISIRFLEQAKAVLPLAIYLIFFQLLLLNRAVNEPMMILSGLMAVIVGLMLFMEGLNRGLMPFGETIGQNLPAKVNLPTVLLISFLLGIGVTFAEPAIGALQAAGSILKVENAPYLYVLLNEWSTILVLIVGLGVGLAVVLGTLRLLYGWSLKPFIYGALVPALGLTMWLMQDDELAKVLGLAWDCGAVTTGPVTVPLVLALGIGIASTAGRGTGALSGFGIVTLASIFPIIGVMLLSLFVVTTTTPEAIITAAHAFHAESAHTITWYEQSPWQEILAGMQAIVPLVAFLMLVLRFILGERLSSPGIIAYGIVLCVLGMIIFNLGLRYGLSMLGEQSGAFLSSAFTTLEGVPSSPLYVWSVGIGIALVFAWVLGFGATVAEPALNALGNTVETLTNGAFEKKLLIYAVAFGVGCGITLGVVKIIFALPLYWFLIPLYSLALLLTWASTEEFVNVAWDSAGVTTGPVTVPLVLAMGIGLGNAVDAIEGFGILSLASVGPILSVLITGLWVQYKIHKKRKRNELLIEGEAA